MAEKKRGRPATGSDQVVTVRLPAILIQQIDDWAAERRITKSEAIRGMIEATIALGGLASEPEPKPAKAPKASPQKADARPVRGWDREGNPIY